MKFTDNRTERINTEAQSLYDEVSTLDKLDISSLEASETMAVFVDIVNGFIREGAMASERIVDIIEPNVRLLEMCSRAGIAAVAFADCHRPDAAEFLSFPPHCIDGTSESRIVEELEKKGGYYLIPKNSTNGFHEKKFRDIMEIRSEVKNFIVTGDCTDICVMQFCLSLKTYFIQRDENIRIIVPVNCVETYDAPYHSSDFANLAAYKLMKDSGIEFVSGIV